MKNIIKTHITSKRKSKAGKNLSRFTAYLIPSDPTIKSYIKSSHPKSTTETTPPNRLKSFDKGSRPLSPAYIQSPFSLEFFRPCIHDDNEMNSEYRLEIKGPRRGEDALVRSASSRVAGAFSPRYIDIRSFSSRMQGIQVRGGFFSKNFSRNRENLSVAFGLRSANLGGCIL